MANSGNLPRVPKDGRAPWELVAAGVLIEKPSLQGRKHPRVQERRPARFAALRGRTSAANTHDRALRQPQATAADWLTDDRRATRPTTAHTSRRPGTSHRAVRFRGAGCPFRSAVRGRRRVFPVSMRARAIGLDLLNPVAAGRRRVRGNAPGRRTNPIQARRRKDRTELRQSCSTGG